MNDDLLLPRPPEALEIGWAVYEHLADRAVSDPTAIARMNPAQLDVYSLYSLRTEVNADGFSSYFQYGYGDLAPIALEAARRLGGPEWHELVEDAMAVLGDLFPVDQPSRETIVLALFRQADERFDALDEREYDLEVVAPMENAVAEFILGRPDAFFES